MHARYFAALVLVLAAASGCLAADDPSTTYRAAEVPAACDSAAEAPSGVEFTAEQASYALHLVNTGSLDRLVEVPGIGDTIAARIVAARPHASLAAVDAVPYVGARVLEGLRRHGDDAAVLDWANNADTGALTAVCHVGTKTAAAIEAARPIVDMDQLAAVRYIGATTLAYMLGTDGSACATKGSVLDTWCGTDAARCWCEDTVSPEPPGGYVLDDDAATSIAEETAGVFYYDNADYVWEEYCESAYDHNLGYDQVDVQNFCDRYVSERYFIAAIDAALALSGRSYPSEDDAYAAVAALMEPLFFAEAPGWMSGFEDALIAHLGAP